MRAQPCQSSDGLGTNATEISGGEYSPPLPRRERTEVRVDAQSPLILTFSRKGRRNLIENSVQEQDVS